ncbi:hypothetical protein CAPTEDRAFT_6286 [Capitella teleta]|uniref:ATP-binding cassette sub-family B member 9 n=1 Tax=Capitella teleta TaxID=283909 RepID=R7TN43_CAPTE|nr:hypothetical protein CAPTEDRAFT_6286 [Capitella teleta]|eukprot:ELT94942.1 hypothetical protein CAPTEDRAFT_6286 [Capitella teleta]
MTKKNIYTLFFIFLSTSVDIITTSILFCHADQLVPRLSFDLKHFHVTQSVFELWVFGAIRSCIITGGLVGVIYNRDLGPKRIEKSSIVIGVLAVFMWAYSLVKMLMFSEVFADDLKQPWFWAIFSWSLLFSLLFPAQWRTLSGVSPSGDKKTESKSVNSDEEPLVRDEEANKQNDEEKKKKKEQKKSITVWRLIKFSTPDIPILLVAFIFMTASSTAEIFTPWFTGQVIQGIAIEKSQSKFTHAIIIMGLLAAASALCAGLRGGFFKVAMVRLNIRIRNYLFLSILNQEIGFFDTTKTGDITSRLTSDVTTMSDTLSLNVNVFLRSLIKSLGVIVFMVRLSWRLTVVTLIGLPIIMGVSSVYGQYYKKLSSSVQDSLAKANEVAEEVVSSMRTVRSFANESDEVKRYDIKLQVTKKLKMKEAFAYAGYIWSNELFALSLIVATLYYGGHLVVNDALTGGSLVSFILYQMELGFALESISYVYSGLMESVGASEKVFEFIDRKPVIRHNGKLKPATLKGHLEFKDVVFSYPSRPETEVLKGVSFKVEPGEVVALVGPSGGGKSSCVNLLEHFYETKSGQVLLDGIDIQQYDHGYLHEKVSLVGQEPVLYARSIKENIAYGLDEWTIEDVEKAAQLANAHDFIKDMADGYDTQTGEKGMQLSGGQKQRVAIARAIIRDPAVLLLDEATSALDAESEFLVQEALYKNLSGRSVVIIAHRLSTVERANRIIFINKGEVVEQGTHAELIQAGKKYAKLVQRQILALDLGMQEDLSSKPSCAQITAETLARVTTA